MYKNIYTNFDILYRELVEYVINNGNYVQEKVRTTYSDGKPAYYMQAHNINFEYETQKNHKNEILAPILTTRYAPYKSAIKEMYWIYILANNNIDYLNDILKVKFWNEWKLKDGTLGKGYGYQINKKTYNYNTQLEYVIGELKNNPNSRRIITELWNVDDLSEMSLTPCCRSTQWTVENGKLNLKVFQRSCDVALGLVSNFIQFYVLLCLVSKEVGLETGNLAWDITNAHIYDRHLDDIQKQIERSTFAPPTLEIPKFKTIFDININEIKLNNYNYREKIAYEIAI